MPKRGKEQGDISEGPMIFTRMLRSIIHDGCLRLIDAAGRSHLIGDNAPPCAVIRLKSKRVEYALALNPALSVGEAYMNGALVIEEGNLYDVLKIGALNYNDI